MKRPASPLIEAQRLLRTIAKGKRAPGTLFPDLAPFRQGYDALGATRTRRLFEDMKIIERCLKAVENERWAEGLERRRREQAGQADFTDQERREILAALHPDSSLSPERREAAFKTFNAKRGRRDQP